MYVRFLQKKKLYVRKERNPFCRECEKLLFYHKNAYEENWKYEGSDCDDDEKSNDNESKEE